MEPERWERIQEIFAEALAQPSSAPEVREAFLRRACGEDSELSEEVRSLLVAHCARPGFLETPAADLLPGDGVDSKPGPPEDDPLIGTRAGAYLMLRRLGQGGMGTVYLGLRDDSEYRQEAAVKVLSQGLETTPLRQRFRQERQILAALDHPALTRLIDGGVLPDGRPYLVMEKVDGRPIDVYCRERDLSVRARLELFRQVCEAVGYAHRNLVVHRDLKPSNVLVQSNGRVKLLDFGIAKLLADEPMPDAAPPTRGDWRLLTPEYASPEQLRGGPVGTAADVFVLGVLLYELLTGIHPFFRPGMPAHEVATAIASLDPPRPSARAPRVGRQLRGDLDIIVMKALRKDAEQRYSSVEALSEDLRRHLEGHPVQARGENPGYRVGKFARRNWAALSMAGAVFALLLGFVIVLSRQNQEIARQSRATARERDRAEQVSSVLVGMFDASDPYSEALRADTLRVRDYLRLRRDRLLEEVAGQPELEAQVSQLLGRVLGNMGLYEEALPLTTRALERLRALRGPESVEEAQCLDFLGTIHQNQGDLETAVRYFRESLAMRRRLLTPPHREIAESLNNLGIALSELGRLDECEPLYIEGLAMRRQLFGNRGTDVAQSLNTLAVQSFRRGDLPKAEALYREALSLRREVLGEVHPYVANLLNNLGRAVQAQGRLAEADSLLRAAIGIWEKTLGPTHPTVSAGLYNLGRLAGERGNHQEAAALLRRSDDLDCRNYPADHIYLADSGSALARALLALKRVEEAEPVARRAVAIYTARKGERDLDTIRARDLLGACLTVRGRYAEAEATLSGALALLVGAGADTGDAARSLRGHLAELSALRGTARAAGAARGGKS